MEEEQPNKIQQLRLGKGWSVRALAAQAGVSPGAISKLETDPQRRATLLTIDKVAKALGVSRSELEELIDQSAAERGRKGAEVKAAKAKKREPATAL